MMILWIGSPGRSTFAVNSNLSKMDINAMSRSHVFLPLTDILAEGLHDEQSTKLLELFCPYIVPINLSTCTPTTMHFICLACLIDDRYLWPEPYHFSVVSHEGPSISISELHSSLDPTIPGSFLIFASKPGNCFIYFKQTFHWSAVREHVVSSSLNFPSTNAVLRAFSS